MNDLPKGWTLATSSDVCSSVRDGTHDTPKYVEEGIPLITSKNLIDGGLCFENTKLISLEDHNQISQRSGVEVGDILFAMIGTIGNPTVVRTEKVFSIKNVGLFKKQPSVVLPEYFCHWLKSREFNEWLEPNLKGSTQRFAPLSVLRTVPIPLAPLNEQHRIVSKLDELLPKVDACKQRLEKIPTLLKRFRQSVLADAVSGKLTEQWRRSNSRNLDKTKHTCAPLVDTPPEWTWMLLKEVCQLKGGVTKGRNLKGKKIISIPYLRVANVQDGFLDLTEMKLIEGTEEDCEKYKLLKGDILFTEGGDRDKLGRGTVWENEIEGCIHQNHIFRARVYSANTAMPDFISLVTKSEFAKAYFFENASQSVNLASLNMTMLGQLPIPIPPINEQVKILEAFASACQHIDALMKRVDRAYTAIERTAQSVLARAFRGELVDQDPTDEPASKLLERLKSSPVEKPKKALPRKRKSDKAEQSLSA
jgi:type I restriction enzyme S subunit